MGSVMSALRGSERVGFHARKAIPVGIREAYARLYGVSWEEKLRVPAGTSLHSAKATWGEWIAEIESRIATLRASARGEGQPLTIRQARALAGRWYSWFLMQNEGSNKNSKHWADMVEFLLWDVIYPLAPDEFHKDTAADPHWTWKNVTEVRAKVRRVVAENALTASFLMSQKMTLLPAANNLFIDAVEDDLIAAFSRLEQLARGDYSPDERLRYFPDFLENHEKPEGELRCWALYEAWLTAVKPTEGTQQRWHVVFKTLDAEFGSVEEVTLSRARVWMDGLIRNGRSAGNIGKVWRTALKTVFAWALRQGLVASNVFTEIKITVPRKTRERDTKAFTVVEAHQILAATLQYAEPRTVEEGARRWVPWICAYTGARGGEITQLRGADIVILGDHHFAKLLPSAGKIKTGKGRVVPLHPHLIDQGFAAFVEARGSGPLFYTAKSDRSEGNNATRPKATGADRMREKIGTWVRSLGISSREIAPNHAWRHTFKAQAARCGIDGRYNDAITGHAPATVGQSYITPTAEDLAEALLKFPRYVV